MEEGQHEHRANREPHQSEPHSSAWLPGYLGCHLLRSALVRRHRHCRTPLMPDRPESRRFVRGARGERYNMRGVRMKANIEIDAGGKTFAAGLTADLIAALRRSRPGDLLAITSGEVSGGAGLEACCRFTGNTLCETSVEASRTRGAIRCGAAPASPAGTHPLGSRTSLDTH